MEMRESGRGAVRAFAVCLMVLLFLLLMSQLPALKAAHAVHAEEAAPQAPQEPIEEVSTIRWKAKLTANISVRVNGHKVYLKEGKNVVVTNRKFSNTGTTGKSKVLIEGKEVRIPNKYLFFVKDLCSVVKQGDYNRATKENFVNRRTFRSKTGYLVWICLDKQRVNIFTGPKSGGNWTLVITCKCSTGKAETPTTPHWNADISFKERRYKYYKNDGYLNYFSEVSGSGMHVWIGGGRAKLFGKHTASNGCTRLSKAAAIWVFENVPVKTRVIIY